MKFKRIFPVLLSLIAILLSAGCSTGDKTPSGSNSHDVPAPSDSVPATPATPQPTEYDFSETVSDEYTLSLTGFEGLPWGYVLPQPISSDLGSKQLITLTLNRASFAGIDFQAEYLFGMTRALPDVSEEDRVLTSGQYSRFGYANLNGQNGHTDMAASDFNQVVAYLTEQFGEPNSCTLFYTTESGKKDESLTAPLTVAQLTASDFNGCAAFWHDLDGAQVSVRLNNTYGGLLLVSFGMNRQ